MSSPVDRISESGVVHNFWDCPGEGGGGNNSSLNFEDTKSKIWTWIRA